MRRACVSAQPALSPSLSLPLSAAQTAEFSLSWCLHSTREPLQEKKGRQRCLLQATCHLWALFLMLLLTQCLGFYWLGTTVIAFSNCTRALKVSLRWNSHQSCIWHTGVDEELGWGGRGWYVSCFHDNGVQPHCKVCTDLRRYFVIFTRGITFSDIDGQSLSCCLYFNNVLCLDVFC